jgi:PAS domain S-box-containing protein
MSVGKTLRLGRLERYGRLMAVAIEHEGVAVGRDGVIRQWPAEWEETIGYSASEAVGQSVELVVPPALRSFHWRGFEKAMAAGRTKRDGKPFTTFALHKSGRLVPIRATLDLTYADDGSPTGACGKILGPGPRWMVPFARALLGVLGVFTRRRAGS